MGANRNGTPINGYGYGANYPQNIHAEPDAVRRAKISVDFGDAWNIVNIRLRKAGEIKLSAPCPCCSAFLTNMGCKSVTFTTAGGWATIRL
mgnify:CR=1 FL=1